MREYIKYGLMGVVALSLTIAVNNTRVEAAPLKNAPASLTQPNGDIIKCFTSGDEFFNYYHDDKDQLIIKNPRTGYYEYGKYNNKDVIPSRNKVCNDGASKKKNEIKAKDIDVPIEKIKEEQKLLQQNNKPIGENVGTLNNIVVFIKFKDQGDFSKGLDFYDGIFNGDGSEENSLYNYYDEASYNQLKIKTTFYPKSDGKKVLTYVDKNPRSYYVNYKPEERTEREHELLKNALEYVKNDIPKNLNLDMNDDGKVDNVCFIIQGATEGWSSLLWPHRWGLFSKDVSINGKKVDAYNFQLDNHLQGSGVGVLAHEMFHSLGAPDLYHYDKRETSAPVGPWDVMEWNGNPPQHMMAYMKQKYGKWIGDIPEIRKDGTYTLKTVMNSNNNAFIIKSPLSTKEYFMVEFRKEESTFEKSLPGEGLLVYRINTEFSGNAFRGDEVYIFRPGGTTKESGNVEAANLNNKDGRVSIGEKDRPIFFSDGRDSGISIKNIKVSGDRVSFDIKLSQNNKKENVFEGEVESINDNDEVNGNLQISGWYVYSKNISKVDILVDGNEVGKATLSSRPDLQDKYPECPTDKSQFVYNLDTTKLTNGKHKISTVATGTDGTKKSTVERNVVVKNVKSKLDFKGELESLTDGEVLKEPKRLTGYFLNVSGIKNCDIFVDRKFIGYASLTSGKDLERKYPEYSLDKARFSYDLDTNSLKPGNHSIIIRGISKENEMLMLERTFKIEEKKITGDKGFKGAVDSIKDGQTVNGIIDIKGWCEADEGLSMIDILLDRKVISLAELKVNNFTGTLDTTKYSNGSHELIVRAIDKKRNSYLITKIYINISN